MTRLVAPSFWREGRLWKSYSLAALALTAAYFLLAAGHATAQTIIYQLFILAAPVAIVVGVRRNKPRRSLHWILFAAGLALWCTGDFYWDSYLWILHAQAPYPSFAEMAYLAGYTVLVAAFLVLARGGGRPRVGNLLDAAIVAVAGGTVMTFYLLKPLVATSNTLFGQAIAIGFPVLDFVILVALMQVLFRRRMANFALQALLVGTVALIATDVVYAHLSLSGAYATGMILDAGWLVCYSLWGIAALHPSMSRIGAVPKRETAELSVVRIVALLVAMLAAPTVLIAETLTGDLVETGQIGAVIVVTTLLVAARVWLLQRESKKTQEALHRSDERLHIAQGVVGISTWEIDFVTGRVVVSEQLAELIGGPGNTEVTYEGWAAFIHPDDRKQALDTFAHARRTGGHFAHEYRFCSPGGQEGALFSRGKVFLGGDGAPIRAVGVAVDVTERHTMEAQLERSDERMQMAQELGGIGTWDADLETGERTWSKNLRRIYGVGDDVKASHESFMELVHPDDRVQLEEAMLAAAENGGHGEFEHRLVRPNDGQVRWMLSRGDAVTDSDGRCLLGVAVDITDRHLAEEEHAKLEQQLRQAHKLEAVGRLAGGVAHDFNNILLAIRGNGELAVDALKHGADPMEEVEEMVAAAARAASLTNQLLAFSRRQVLQAEVLDLNEVVGDMDKLLRRMIGEDVELRAIVSGDSVHISADRSQIEQVVANLAVNARDAMPDGGLLTLEVTTAEIGPEGQIDVEPGRYAMLSVSDTGLGMDPETVAKIFEPFFTTKDEGTGFGLSTVHGIVVQSGGSIWVYSELDHGTTFKIFLPLAEQPSSVESNRSEGVGSVTASVGETILLVEDDPHVQRIVANILRRSGYRVLAANGAEQARGLAEAERETIHLLLSDLVMPGTSGRELAEQIQVMRPGISILYMSGYTDDVVVRRGVLESGMAFIQKPFGAEDLGRRVREVLDLRDDRSEAA